MSDNKNILPFDGTKYNIWKSRVRALIDETILDENALSVIDNEERPESVSESEWLKRNKIAKGIIIRNLSDSVVGYATHDPTLSARKILEKLDSLYNRKSVATELAMELKLSNFKYNESNTLTKHIMLFDDLITDYEIASGDKLKETYKIAKLLSSLPKTYTPLVVAIQTLSDENLTLAYVKIRLLEYEVQLNSEVNDNNTKALVAHSSNFVRNNNKYKVNQNKRYKHNFKKYNRNYNKNKHFKNNNKYNKNKVICDHCGRNNHVKENCFYYKKYVENSSIQNNAAYINQQHHFAFMTRVNEKSREEIASRNTIDFLLDSGATDHMVNQLDVFSTIEDLDEPLIISIAKKDHTITATKRGTIKVTTNTGYTGTLNNVLYVPESPNNLLSVKRIQASRMSVVFKDTGEVTIENGGKTIINGKVHKNLIFVTFNINTMACNQVNTHINKFTLWHERLGHIEKSKFLQLQKNDLVINSEILKGVTPFDHMCEACIVSKQSRLSFNKEKNRTHVNRPLYVIHSDVCGPIKPSSLDDKNYFVTFIDEYTHYTVVYLLKYKSEVFKVFNDFVNKCEAMFNSKIAYLYCDNGNEYLSNEFKEFCSQKGIQYHLTVPYTPQQNSIAERMNRTLVEKARAMVHGAKLSKEFWGEAILTAAYMINISPTKAIIQNKTPYELWHNKKPSLKQIRIFGCTVYMLKKTHKDKFDEKSIKGILVGYVSNGYKVFDPETKKFVISRDIVFDEINFKTSRPTVNKNEDNQESSLNLETDMNYKISQQNSINGQEISESVKETGEVNETDKSIKISINSNKRQKTDTTKEVSKNINKKNKTDKISINQEDENINSPNDKDIHRRSARLQNKPIISYNEDDDHYHHVSAQCILYDIPNNYNEIKDRNDRNEWQKAINEELKSLYKNKTFSIVPCPKNKNVIDCRWVFSIKRNPNSNIPKYKARLVAKGFTQQYMLDYFDTFAPVARITTLRLMLALANQYNLLAHQMDVKTAFLNGPLDEEIYMKIPEVINVDEGYVYKLNKAIYGLKQAARCWFMHFDQVIKKYGFINSTVDRCLYILNNNDISKNIYLLLYVDDILIFTRKDSEMNRIKIYLKSQFEMVDMEEIKTFLGIRVKRSDGVMTLDQTEYLEKVLEKFSMSSCNSINTPLPIKLNYEALDSDIHYQAPCRELLGCLMYAMLCTRPDLCLSLNLLSRFQNKNNIELWQSLKRILRYVKGTINFRLVYRRTDFKQKLLGFADSDWGSNEIDRRSTTGYIFKIFDRNTICWNSKRQNSVAASSTEAEYMALYEAIKEACWLRSLIISINIEILEPIKIYEDNNGCIAIANNPTDHKRSKHIDIKYHFSREKVEQKLIKIEFISTENQLADVFTKTLPAVKFTYFRKEIGMDEMNN